MSSFNGKISLQAWMVTPETRKVMDALGNARFVGGCVRDALANRRVVDIDIATPLTPQDVIARLTAHQIKYAETGIKHGTVTAIVDGHPFEITTLRRDVETFGRHAEVAFTDSWEEDASRRDFTVNAMSCTIDGNVFDPFGGIEDLRQGRIRFVGDAGTRIAEDVLRILRFFRFTAYFGRGEPDAEALAACTQAAAKITTLSHERLRKETLKLLDSDNSAGVWALMIKSGVAAQYLPHATDVSALEKLVALEIAHHSHGPDTALRRLAALGGAGATDSLRLSNAEAARLATMTAAAPALASEKDIRRAVYRLGNDMTRSLMLLHAARHGTESNFSHLFEIASSFRSPRFPLQGQDVLARGHAPGPDVGRLLHAVEEWWIAQDFAPTRVECLDKLGGLK